MSSGKKKDNIISRWTGKFDFYDDCEMIHTSDEMVECSDVYLGDAKVEIKSKNDLIPYYTHTIASACYSKSDGNTIHLSKESFIDSEEKDFLVWRIMDAIRIARKAKKEKKHFNLDYLMSELGDTSDTTPDFLWKKIISIVNGQPDLIKEHISKDYRVAADYITGWLIPNYFYDVHDSSHNRMREEFVEYCKEKGFSIIERTFKELKRTKGIYHPIIMKMCMKIDEYYRMESAYR